MGPLLIGTAAIGVAHWPGSDQAFWVNLFWLALMLSAAILTSAALWRGARLAPAGEIVLAAVTVQALWSVAFSGGEPPRPVVGERSGVSWTLAFTEPQQSIEKSFERPEGWRIDATYLRVDLGARYAGDAGFQVWANGEYVGLLDRTTTAESVMTLGIPAWSIRIPLATLARSPAVRVELRPSAVDRRLQVAGQSDPLIDRTQRHSSRFFDGLAWHRDQLDGGAGLPKRAAGTYRIWLLRAWGELVPPAELQGLHGHGGG